MPQNGLATIETSAPTDIRLPISTLFIPTSCRYSGKKLVKSTTVPYTKKLNHFKEVKDCCLLKFSHKFGTPFPPDALHSLAAL
ncbi:hypothetical protein D3C73_1403110 [compost metagenome]